MSANPDTKNVSGSKLCCHDRGISAKCANIWLLQRHVANMSATLSAKCKNRGVGGGGEAGGNNKLAADRHTQKSTLKGDGNGGRNCDGNVDGNLDVDGYVDDDGGSGKRK